MREFADDQSLDIRPGRFFILEIGADISNVRIGEADILARIAGIAEDFLVSGEAGIKNNFAAPAGASARRAAVKDAPVFQREYRGSVLNFGQWVLPYFSSKCAIHLVLASVVESDPK